MKKEVEIAIAKKLLESKGYKVSEKVNVSYSDDDYDDYDDWQKGRRNFGPYDDDEEPPFPSVEINDDEIIDNLIHSYEVKAPMTSGAIYDEVLSDYGPDIASRVATHFGFGKSKDVDEHLEVAPNHTSTTAQKVEYVKKMVEKAKNEGDEHSAWDIVDFLWDSMLLDKIPLDESKNISECDSKPTLKDSIRKRMKESTDDSQQRRIVKNIANEVIRSKGQNNSTGTYDKFIRKMMDNWATSGHDREFIKSAIEKSFDKEYGKRMKESTDEYGRSLAELPESDPLCAELRSLGLTEKDIDPVASSDKYHEYHGKSEYHRIPISYDDLDAHGYEYLDTGSSDYTSGSRINFEKGYMITLVASTTGYVSIQKVGPTALEKIKSGTFDHWNDDYSK